MSPIRSTLEAATCNKSETNNKRTLIVEKLAERIRQVRMELTRRLTENTPSKIPIF